MNNVEFIEGFKCHDPAAAKHLHQCFVPSLWRFVCFRVDGDAHVAEDIVSEAVLALVAAIERGVEIEHPSAWLRMVATRRVQDHYRAAARVKHLMQATAESQVNEAEATVCRRQEEDQQRRQDVHSAMAALPENHRLALEWKYMDRLTVREIASRLDTTAKAVESILFRARKQMRAELGKLDREELIPIEMVGPRSKSQGQPEQVPEPNLNLPMTATGDAMRLRP